MASACGVPDLTFPRGRPSCVSRLLGPEARRRVRLEIPERVLDAGEDVLEPRPPQLTVAASQYEGTLVLSAGATRHTAPAVGAFLDSMLAELPI